MWDSSRVRFAVAWAGLALTLSLGPAARAQPTDTPTDPRTERAAEWVARFRFEPPTAHRDEVCPPSERGLPGFVVTPAARGRQLVRVALPFGPGALPSELGLAVTERRQRIIPDVRILTHHPGTPVSVRRALVTFVHDFPDLQPRTFAVELQSEPAREPERSTRTGAFRGRMGDLRVSVSAAGVELARAEGPTWRCEFMAPPRTWSESATVEVIEDGPYYLWVRLLIPDGGWPRILEVRADATGTVVVRGHLQRGEKGDERAPDLGLEIVGPALTSLQVDDTASPIGGDPVEHAFDSGGAVRLQADSTHLTFPDAHFKQRGGLTVRNTDERSQTVYLRCRADERVPHQPAAWRTASVVFQPPEFAPLNALFEPAHRVVIAPDAFTALYPSGLPTDLSPWPRLQAARQLHVEAIAGCTLPGDDFGNVTSMPRSGVFGMNRLNHCPAIFHEYYRASDPRLREVALQWCHNFHDLSIWWGRTDPKQFGGTRYNNVARQNAEHRADDSFMWRSNNAVHFCTKGYDSFFYAYEETGDPRMATALRWQTAYATESVHADQGECRNIGDVLDFVRLYAFTHQPDYLAQGLRLFRELRTRLSEGDLFSQGGRPIVPDPPFIDDDKKGYQHPFAKPYIIGYGLAGLPALTRYVPDEPKLRDVIRAVADFQARVQDPVGGWRYPHPRSSRVIVGQAIEHGAQLARAAAYLESRDEPIDNLLDAIERALQARILVGHKRGKFFNGLGSWEAAAGVLTDGKTIYDLYAKPADRDRRRDYTEGAVGIGGTAPESVVYFSEVLRFYLAHRPAERLFNASAELQTVLDRIKPDGQSRDVPKPDGHYSGYGMADKLPTFRDAAIDRLTFPMSYDPTRASDFSAWRRAARQKLLDCLLAPPPRAPFAPVVTAREDRGGYEARKLVFNVSADCRVPAYLLVPQGPGPFPAIITLHDHGAAFLIGKEKVVRPFAVDEPITTFADKWVKTCYGGRWIGDELAKRGYVVFAMDALFWGERGRKEGVDYDSQQVLASNLLQMGITWVGVITWDDLRSAEFVASLPEVDPARIGAVGLSMGSHRTWMLCGATDRVAAGVAVCWMGTTAALMSVGNNQTKGSSAYSMLVPGLRNFLDYPDVAAIACPKPMMFFNGEKDGLFPVAGVNDAYARMRRVWASQGVADRLVTKLRPVAHVFNVEMQGEAFGWLDRCLGKSDASRD